MISARRLLVRHSIRLRRSKYCSTANPAPERQRQEMSSAQTATTSLVAAVWWASRNANTSRGELDRSQMLAKSRTSGWSDDSWAEECIRVYSLTACVRPGPTLLPRATACDPLIMKPREQAV